MMNTLMSQEALEPVLERLGMTLLHFLWQGTLIALGLAVVRRFIGSPRTQYTSSLAALLLLAACPVITFMTGAPACAPSMTPSESVTSDRALVAAQPGVDSGSSLAIPAQEVADVSRVLGAGQFESEPEVSAAGPVTLAACAGFIRQNAAPWAVAAWLLGVMLFSGQRAVGWWNLRRWSRNAPAAVPATVATALKQLRAKLGIRQRVQVVACARTAVPVVFGVLKPIILLPASALSGLPPQQLEAVLAHELAHIRRWDTAVVLFQTVIETLLFYHPAVWWVSRLVKEDREKCADDLAVEVCPDRASYARALASLASEAQLPAWAPAATSGALLQRIRRILGQPVARRSGSTVPLSLLLMSALAVGGWALWSSRALAAEQVVEVPAGGSIQEAINRAPAGGTVRVPPGTYLENLVVTKPLTLEGAAWDKSVVIAKVALTSLTPELLATIQEAIKAAKDRQEADRVRDEWRERLEIPTLKISQAANVVIRGLRFGAPAPPKVEGLMSTPVVSCSGTRDTLLENCAVIGPFWDGIHVINGGSVTMQRCLVAGLWGTGIMVEGKRGERPASQARIEESELRNCYHRCVTFGAGCDTSSVSKSRISGSAWHGVRYDNASPTIEGCAIFGNARCGIYASGQTSATVKGNLFYGNEMDGISCWYQNEDLIQGNTFVANKREGIMVLGRSQPKVTRNVFFGQPAAVRCGLIGGDNSKAVGRPVLQGNWFWENKSDFVAMAGGATNATESPVPLPQDAGNVVADPGFKDIAGRDYALRSDSPARRAEVGASAPLALASPWPLTDGEQAIVPDGETRDSESWKKPGKEPARPQRASTRTAMDNAKRLADEAFRIDSKEARDAAIATIKQRVESANPDEQLEGLHAFRAVQGVEFNNGSFREPIRRRLGSPDELVRAAAVTALAAADPEPGDLDRVMALATDPAGSVRTAVAGAVVALSKKNLTGPAGDVMFKLLNDEIDQVRSDALRALWGATVSPAIEARLIQLSRETDDGGEALYFGLSTLANKSEAGVARLIEFLAHRDLINVAGRALWGLGYGVPESLQPRVAEAVMRLLEARSDRQIRQGALDRLRQYGTAAEARKLEAMAAQPAISAEYKDALRKTAEEIARRLGK